MLIGMRNAILAGATLPYDAEVEYLQGDGSAYIDTGVVITGSSIEVEVDAAFALSVNGRNQFAIATKDVDGNYFGIRTLKTAMGTTNYLHAFGASKSNGGTSRRIYLIRISNGEVQWIRDGSELSSENIVLHDITLPIYLFALNSVNGTLGIFTNKIYSARIALGGTDVFNCIPVRFTNENGVTEGAMYDKVSGTLFRNAGTGAFTIGPDASAA